MELHRRHPELHARTVGASVVDLSGAIKPEWAENPTVQGYRNVGDPMSMFDTKARSTLYGKFHDNSTLTHQYANNAQNKPE